MEHRPERPTEHRLERPTEHRSGGRPTVLGESLATAVSLRPPHWAFALVDAPDAPWQDADPDVRVRTLSGDRFALTSVICRRAVRLSEADFRHATAQAYRLLREQIDGGRAWHLVRIWNFIPGILTPLGELPERYMVFNAGRFAAYEEWYRDRDSFDREVATASGVGHEGADLVIHGLAATTPGTPVENPRQVPSYRYSPRYGPLPPCFARASRVIVDPARGPWLLVGGTASVCGEETVHPGDLDAQAAETCRNLAALVAGAIAGGEANDHLQENLLARYRYLRAYYVRDEHGARVARWIGDRFPDAEVELVQVELCRDDLLVEVEGVADLT